MDAKDKKIFNPTTHLSHVKQINKAAMQGAVKRSKIVVAALSDGFFTSDGAPPRSSRRSRRGSR